MYNGINVSGNNVEFCFIRKTETSYSVPFLVLVVTHKINFATLRFEKYYHNDLT